MGRKSSNVVNAEINQLRRILESGQTINKSDIDIMQELQIKRATYYRYKEKIRIQDREAWKEMAKESLEERSKKIMNAIDFALTHFKKIATESTDDRAKIEALKNVIQANVWAKELLEKGPKVMSKLELEEKLQIEPENMESMEKQTL